MKKLNIWWSAIFFGILILIGLLVTPNSLSYLTQQFSSLANESKPIQITDTYNHKIDGLKLDKSGQGYLKFPSMILMLNQWLLISPQG